MALAAVTGATGFLGRHLVRELAAAGWRIRVLTRRDVIHPLWRDIEVEAVVGGLENDQALDRLCQGADLVVHAAGLIKARDLPAFQRVNVEGSRRVAERAAGAMLMVSSLAAREPQLSDYAASKRGGEEAAEVILGKRLTVARPPALYGPGDVETLPLFKLAASSPILPVFNPQARIAMMHVADAARQIAALTRAPGGLRVALSDARPQGYGWREILGTAAAAFGANPSFIRLPDATFTLAAHLAKLGAGAPMLSLGKAREIRHLDWSVGPGEQPVDLPAPLFDLGEGFLHTIDAYRASGVIFGSRDSPVKR